MTQRKNINSSLKKNTMFLIVFFLCMLIGLIISLFFKKIILFAIAPISLGFLSWGFALFRASKITCAKCNTPFKETIWYGKKIKTATSISEQLKFCPCCGVSLDLKNN